MTADLFATAAAAVYAAWWWLSRRLWPWHRCPVCNGSGRSFGSNRKRWGDCLVCKGRGRRQRWGAKWVHPELRRKK